MFFKEILPTNFQLKREGSLHREIKLNENKSVLQGSGLEKEIFVIFEFTKKRTKKNIKKLTFTLSMPECIA